MSVHVRVPRGFSFGGYRIDVSMTRLQVLDRFKKTKRDADLDDLVERLLDALKQVQNTTDEDTGHKFHGNQWTGGLGAKPEEVKSKGVKSGVHELLSSGHGFTMEELQKVTGATTIKQISDALAMLKNPKYAGSQGVLEIVKVGNHYGVKAKVDTVAVEAPLAAPAPSPASVVPPPTAKSAKEAADIEYAQAQNDNLKMISAIALKTGKDASEAQLNSIALSWLNAKAGNMAQWAVLAKGVEFKPKAQQVHAADLAFIKAMAGGQSPASSLADWKKNTTLEKQGKYPPKDPINAMPTAHHIPAIPKITEPIAAKYEPVAQYVPEDWQGIGPQDFKHGEFESQLGKLKKTLGGGDAIQNKVGIQKSLTQRLADSPAFSKCAALRKSSSHSSLEATLISAWAGSSGDHQAVSVANQLAVRDAFAMDPSKVSTKSFHLLNSVNNDEHQVYKQAAQALNIPFTNPAEQATFKTALRDFALAQYHSTQEHLASLGITEVSVARGMKIAHSKEPDLVNLRLQPASSFSANFGTAAKFSGGQSLYFAKVPVSQVLSTYRTGFGCTSEHEVVLLAHPKMKAVRMGSGSVMSIHGAMEKVQASEMMKSVNAPPTSSPKPQGTHIHVHGVPKHISSHALFEPKQYEAWKAQGKTDFQIGKNLAAKKFALKKKGL